MSELYDKKKHGAGLLAVGPAAPAAPWYATMWKMLAALAAAVVFNASLITATVKDGPMNSTKWLVIGLAVLGSIVTPGAVYLAPRNADRTP